MTPPPQSSDTVSAAATRPSAAADVTSPAPLFHLALRLEGRPCLVVGGGPVGARKAASLLECGALVTIVSPQTCRLVDDLPVTVARRPYRSGEAAAYSLVVTATGIPALDAEVYRDAEQAGVLVNAADDPASCSFLMPAVLHRGDVSVAVSTGGVSPWLAGWIRRRVAGVIGPEVATLATIVGEARTRIRAAGISSEGLDWGNLVDGALWPLVNTGSGGAAAARSVVTEWVAAVLAGDRSLPCPDGAAAEPAGVLAESGGPPSPG
jgi:precorrin-2 dehydrogenase/sirohydrochlorin ferrochelatase